MEEFGFENASRAADLVRDSLIDKGLDADSSFDGIILGSGLGSFPRDHMRQDSRIDIPFSHIFEELGIESHDGAVPGHARSIVLGQLEGAPESALIFAQSGREHPYEGISTKRATFWIRVMQVMGVRSLLGSNAAGILTPKTLQPPALMAVAASRDDGGDNPLIGPNDERLGPRFPHMADLYTWRLRKRMQNIAQEMHIRLQEGVYFRTKGPNYEDVAHVYELRSRLQGLWQHAIAQPEEKGFQYLPTGVVGMSSTYEALVAKHASQSSRIPAFRDGIGFISVATNYAASLSVNGLAAPPSHEEVQQRAAEVQKNFGALIHGTLLSMQKESHA